MAHVTSSRETILHDLKIENTRVADLLYDDFNAYQSSFDDRAEGSAHQDLRASFVSWFMIFAPEVFPPDLASEIGKSVQSAEEPSDYQSYGWHNTLHFRSGLFAYDGSPLWLTDALGNLAHHNSSLRRYVARTVAPVIRRIRCDNPQLVSAIDENLQNWHFYNEYSLALFVASNGSDSAKLDQLRLWREKYSDSQDEPLLASLMSGEWIPNPYTAQFSRVERYVMLRLCSRPDAPPIQSIGAWGAPASSSGLRQIPLRTINADEVLARIERHPLAGAYIRTPGEGVAAAGEVLLSQAAG